MAGELGEFVVFFQTSMPSVLVLIADGSEEIEAVGTIDTLRRAELVVTVASVSDSLQVVCSRGVKLVADALFSDVQDQDFDAVVLPG
jgi:protein deglycase